MKPLRVVSVLPLVVLAACAARRENPPASEAEPAIITEQAPAAEPAPATPTPPPDQPAPPPDQPPPAAATKPEQTDTGRFRISIASVDSAAVAEKWMKKAQDAGYRAEVVAFEVDGKTVQRVLLPGYDSLEAARAALPAVQQDLGAPQAWVISRLRAGTEVGAAPAATAAEPPMPAPPPPEGQPAN